MCSPSNVKSLASSGSKLIEGEVEGFPDKFFLFNVKASCPSEKGGRAQESIEARRKLAMDNLLNLPPELWPMIIDQLSLKEKLFLGEESSELEAYTRQRMRLEQLLITVGHQNWLGAW